ncbi:MAG: type I methionyl aminopeptidase [Deltaproteobacteria bacterium]|nr:type I methionyl aminopeptidase [Deltaproteobacteria bacterium]
MLKSKADIDVMRRANMIVYDVLCALKEMVRVGITTAELNEKALEMTLAARAKPAFLGYPGVGEVRPFPAVICASVNECIVHGIPNDVPLKEGDVLSIDYGCCYEGFFGDSAVTVPVGEISEAAAKLISVTAEALEDAILQCRCGKYVGDISSAVQRRVESNGFGVVREFVGHGIGRKMHEPPHVPNFGKRGQGEQLRAGMVLAIEPMVTAGSYEVEVLEDGWSAVTKDRSLAAHWEHSIAVTEAEPVVLSRP